MTEQARWVRVRDADVPADGRVRSVVVAGRSIAMSRCGGQLGALENKCPHQGGPLGEGSIEKGLLRCPWHGYDYDPLTGVPPEGFADAVPGFPVQERPDGVYVELPEIQTAPRTVADVLVETLVAFGVRHVFGMVGHSNLGFADALRRAEERGEITYVGIRHEGAAAFAASAYGKLTGRPAACLAIAGPGSTNLLTGLYDARLDQSPVIAISGQVASKVLGRGAFQDLDLSAVFQDVAVSSVTLQAGSDHAELAALAVKHAMDRRGVAHLVLPDEVQVLPSQQPAASPERAAGRARREPAGRGRRDRGRAGVGRPPPGHRRRARRPRCPRPGDRPGRAAGCAGSHHLQGQGAGSRHPPAGRRGAGPQRHAGGELADERIGPDHRGRRVLLESHRHRDLQTGHPDRRRSGRNRAFRPGWRPPGRRRRVDGAGPGRRHRVPSRRPISGRMWPSGGPSGVPKRPAG